VVVAGDTFLPHELTEEQIKAVALVVATRAPYVAVRIARKQLRHFPKQRLFVVVLDTRANGSARKRATASWCEA
jgi:hypothetical protein